MLYTTNPQSIANGAVYTEDLKVIPGTLDFLFLWANGSSPWLAGFSISLGAWGRIIPAVGSNAPYIYPSSIYGQEFSKIKIPVIEQRLVLEINNGTGSSINAEVIFHINEKDLVFDIYTMLNELKDLKKQENEIQRNINHPS